MSLQTESQLPIMVTYLNTPVLPSTTFCLIQVSLGDTGFLGSDISPYHSGNYVVIVSDSIR